MNRQVISRQAVSRQTESFLDALWEVVQTVEPKFGVAIDITGHAEWLGAEAKAGSKLAYYLPSLVEVSLVDVVTGLNAGVDLPNWLPTPVYANLAASLGGALVGVVELSDLDNLQFVPRAKLSIPAMNCGVPPIPGFEVECTHLNIYFDVLHPEKLSLYFTLGVGLALPFLPDIGKLLVQISPKLKAKGELHGILRLDFNASALGEYINQ
jgi:hypothetical protein